MYETTVTGNDGLGMRSVPITEITLCLVWKTRHDQIDKWVFDCRKQLVLLFAVLDVLFFNSSSMGCAW